MDRLFFDRWFAAYNARDLDALCELADPNIEFTPLRDTFTALNGTTYHGHAGLRTLLEPGFERFPGLRVHAGDPIQAANSVIVPIKFTLDDSVDPPLTRTAVAVFTFAGERVRMIESFETLEDAAASIGHPSALTAREREIIGLLSKGLSPDKVAEVLVLSPLTVRTHIRNAKDKLGARTTAHAIAIAIRDHEVEIGGAA